MSIEHVTRRHLDAGQPFLVRHDSHPGFVLLMRTCAAPRCPCTEVDVELLPHDALEALNTDHPAVSVRFDARTRTVIDLSDPDHLLEAPVDETWLRAQLDGDVGARIGARFDRLRASKDRSTWQTYAWSKHVQGDMVAHHELFPHDWDILVRVGSVQTWLVDSYCITARCTCQDVSITVIGLDSEPIGDALLRLGGRERDVRVVRCAPTARPFINDAVFKLKVGSLLHRRFREMRRVAKRLKTWSADMADPAAAIHMFVDARTPLTQDALDRVQALGLRATDALTAIVTDPNTSDVRRIRGARFLAAIGEPACAAALASLLKWPAVRADSEAYNDVVDALVELREAAVEPLLAVAQDASPEDEPMIDVLADLRVADPRVLALLVERARRAPARWTDALRWQGPAALHVVREILDTAMNATPLDWEAAHEAIDVIEDLGERADDGVLDRIEQARAEFEEALAAERAEAEAATRRAATLVASATRAHARPGRNRPCWCGSGKKYKNCHLGADEAEGDALAMGASP